MESQTVIQRCRFSTIIPVYKLISDFYVWALVLKIHVFAFTLHALRYGKRWVDIPLGGYQIVSVLFVTRHRYFLTYLWYTSSYYCFNASGTRSRQYR